MDAVLLRRFHAYSSAYFDKSSGGVTELANVKGMMTEISCDSLTHKGDFTLLVHQRCTM